MSRHPLTPSREFMSSVDSIMNRQSVRLREVLSGNNGHSDSSCMLADRSTDVRRKLDSTMEDHRLEDNDTLSSHAGEDDALAAQIKPRRFSLPS